MPTDSAVPRADKLPWTAHVATYLYPTLVTLVLFAAWEAVTRAGMVSPLILPSLSSILQTAVVKFSLLMQMSAITATEFLLGFALSVAVGLPLGALIVYSRPLETAFYPILVAFQIVPKAAVAPIFIVWLGTGALFQSADRICHRVLSGRNRHGGRAALRAAGNHPFAALNGRQSFPGLLVCAFSECATGDFRWP